MYPQLSETRTCGGGIAPGVHWAFGCVVCGTSHPATSNTQQLLATVSSPGAAPHAYLFTRLAALNSVCTSACALPCLPIRLPTSPLPPMHVHLLQPNPTPQSVLSLRRCVHSSWCVAVRTWASCATWQPATSHAACTTRRCRCCRGSQRCHLVSVGNTGGRGGGIESPEVKFEFGQADNQLIHTACTTRHCKCCRGSQHYLR
jgi:hypothetical protein